MTVRNVTVAGTRFLLREEGTGPGVPVLLLHGVPETSSCWRDVQPALADGRRVLAPDLPGLGGSSYAGPYDLASLVAQVAALIEAEAPDQVVDVVGHDWGGVVALGLAGARPDLVRRLVVANAPWRDIPLPRASHVPFFALPFLPELLFRLGGRRVVDVMLALVWKSPTPLDADRKAEYEAAYTDPASVSAMLGYYRAAARPRAAALVGRSGLPEIPAPTTDKTLVLWGAKDPVLPLSTGEGVVRDLGASCVMVTFPEAGHFVIEEATDEVLLALTEFLVPDQPPKKSVRARPAAKA